MPRRKKKVEAKLHIVAPKEDQRCPERVTIETVGDREIIKIAPGEPMVLQGTDPTGQWKDVCVVCNKGGIIEVAKDEYGHFRLESDTNRRMLVKPPVSLPVYHKKDADKPKILKDETDE